MKVEVINYVDHWQEVKNAAMNTIGKSTGKYPTSKWKMGMLTAEHSPIRLLELTISMTDIPYWVAMHLVRHHVGVTPFVSTQRTDRTGENRSEKPQDAPVNLTIVANAQALINISRKRLCGQASPETRAVWKAVKEAVRAVEPELATLMVPECLYRGKCPEMHCCGYSHNFDRFIDDLVAYRTNFPS